MAESKFKVEFAMIVSITDNSRLCFNSICFGCGLEMRSQNKLKEANKKRRQVFVLFACFERKSVLLQIELVCN